MKLPGDKVTSIKSGDAVQLIVGRYLPIDLSGMRVESVNGTFQLPSSREVFEKTENATFVDVQVSLSERKNKTKQNKTMIEKNKIAILLFGQL